MVQRNYLSFAFFNISFFFPLPIISRSHKNSIKKSEYLEPFTLWCPKDFETKPDQKVCHNLFYSNDFLSFHQNKKKK